MKEKLKSSSSTYLVTQSNDLIEADYSNSNLSLKSMKIAKLVVARLSPDDTELRLIRISNRVIKQYLGYNSEGTYNRYYQDMKDVCERLNEQAICIVLPNGNVLNAFFISSWEIDHQSDETVFEISGRLKPYLLQLRSNYTSYQLGNIPRLKRTYSVRLYELLCQYRRIGKREFEIEDLKKKIGCSYKAYGHLKDRAIIPAQRELIQETDIRFEFEEVKDGRKVSRLVFYIYPNNPQSENPQQVFSFLEDEFNKEGAQPLSDEAIELFRKIGISAKNLASMLSKGFNIINDEETRALAEKRCRTIEQYYIEKLTLLHQSKSKSNPAGFLINALKEDWLSPTLFKNQKSDDVKKAKLQRQKKYRELERKEEVLRLEYDSERKKIIEEYFKVNAESLQILLKQVKEKYSNVARYIKSSLSPEQNYAQSMMITSLVNIALEEQKPELFERVQSMKIELEKCRSELKLIKS